ncbi:1-(5-phosphoribosyl)-5-[(5-phosphoribosylamino)methylideneamino]imidazole-4-carboxamide isomerase [Oenococcus kitaharae]|uniref:1-(5-phosphoribosyl)-5-[(5-phosphoribosylamino)methylideneamino] imidazole-4-carboxamide isomerase n=1 Tax=Oenococcus kitaharae DSM 17330 TaxID=1045004 RepID=G9WHC3_9LACO|nr:1-(5-phosphoribosyl)-5-[(5-phosphoribosylamino)methylideneamino]imidazole-4-carboxamide isomerase [Oenococcus kitaharae]EHN59768.1 Phosphoribosylformimino-5-aminoimidazole carboxamide ribotide isomerase [Oenococcus kitaharae DSM 17330]OEY83592.1 1-(5-phosphoribosyl)-5-[(5-phosphoribosylamino)methylideneamino] imidazole-4-carboxamide isomerase [Oenococcus kitaharae]OEY85390.1 1-(5-phosphoribosyl)-5-[(5-phosphoribosylamino)methylideneamino] imidazole-4-carboxamide isomerase [Oenococcus kitahara
MIYPAIDLQNGQSVRLYQGDFKQQVLVANDPVRQAENINQAGIRQLHLVDLDGAKEGQPKNLAMIQSIRAAFNGRIELGGGIRSMAQLEKYLQLGIDRIIIGSATVENPAFVKEALAKFGPDKIVIGVDGSQGRVATEGWLEQSKVLMVDLIATMRAAGARQFIVTDVTKDGTMQGPNSALLLKLQAAFPDCSMIVSGGIRNLADIQDLFAKDLTDMIIGKALFEGALTLQEIAEAEKNVS